MENFKNAVAEHRTFATILILGFTVFINCFGFPIYNFEKAFSPIITMEYLLLSVLSCSYIGGGLAVLYPRKRYVSVLILLLALTGAGMPLSFGVWRSFQYL